MEKGRFFFYLAEAVFPCEFFPQEVGVQPDAEVVSREVGIQVVNEFRQERCDRKEVRSRDLQDAKTGSALIWQLLRRASSSSPVHDHLKEEF